MRRNAAAFRQTPTIDLMNGVLFRERASWREKALTLCGIATCFLAIYGLAYDFSPSAETERVAWFGATPLAMLFTVSFLRVRTEEERFRDAGRIRKVCISGATFLMALALSWAAIGLGIASLANAAIGTTHISRARVVGVPHPNYGKGCRFAAHLQYVMDSRSSVKVCLSEAYWSSLRKGQEVSVIQKRSTLGTDIVGFE